MTEQRQMMTSLTMNMKTMDKTRANYQTKPPLTSRDYKITMKEHIMTLKNNYEIITDQLAER